MTVGFFLLTAVLVTILCVAIYGLKYILKNYYFSQNPKTQLIAEVLVKVVMGILAGLVAYVLITFLAILLAPLFEQLNTAFAAATTRIFDCIDKLIPYAVLGGIGWYWWKNRNPQKNDEKEIVPIDVESAEQEAEDVHGDLGELVYHAAVDTATHNDLLIGPRDPFGMETGRDRPYRMEGDQAIHQFFLNTTAAPTEDEEKQLIQDLQRHANQRRKRYNHLCRNGYPPIIFDVRGSGNNFVTVEVVLYSEKHMDQINAQHSARFGRQLDYKRMGDAYDRDF